MAKKIESFGDKKTKIVKLLDNNGFIDIVEKDIKNPRGRLGVPKKYVNCKAIILIVESPVEKRGRGS